MLDSDTAEVLISSGDEGILIKSQIMLKPMSLLPLTAIRNVVFRQFIHR
jgi:hypothetical protein